MLGRIDIFLNRCDLYVLKIKDNPLEKFVKGYESESNGAPKSKAKSKGKPKAPYWFKQK